MRSYSPYFLILVIIGLLVALLYKTTNITNHQDELIELIKPLKKKYPSKSNWKFESDSLAIDLYYFCQFSIAPILLTDNSSRDTIIQVNSKPYNSDASDRFSLIDNIESEHWSISLKIAIQ